MGRIFRIAGECERTHFWDMACGCGCGVGEGIETERVCALAVWFEMDFKCVYELWQIIKLTPLGRQTATSTAATMPESSRAVVAAVEAAAETAADVYGNRNCSCHF